MWTRRPAYPAAFPTEARDAGDDLIYWTAFDLPPLLTPMLERTADFMEPGLRERVTEALATTPHARIDAYGLVGPGRYTGRCVDLASMMRYLEALDPADEGVREDDGDEDAEGY